MPDELFAHVINVFGKNLGDPDRRLVRVGFSLRRENGDLAWPEWPPLFRAESTNGRLVLHATTARLGSRETYESVEAQLRPLIDQAVQPMVDLAPTAERLHEQIGLPVRVDALYSAEHRALGMEVWLRRSGRLYPIDIKVGDDGLVERSWLRPVVPPVIRALLGPDDLILDVVAAEVATAVRATRIRLLDAVGFANRASIWMPRRS